MLLRCRGRSSDSTLLTEEGISKYESYTACKMLAVQGGGVLIIERPFTGTYRSRYAKYRSLYTQHPLYFLKPFDVVVV